MLRIPKKIKARKAQAIMSEYVLIFFIIIGMITAMTVFFKRAVQARYYDARRAMFNIVAERVKGNYNGAVYPIYEPYYVNAQSYTYRDDWTKQTLDAGGSSGIYTKDIGEYIQMKSNSQTAAPKDSN